MNRSLTAFLVVILVVYTSINTALALQSSDMTVTSTLSTYSVSPGGSIIVAVTIQNNVDTQFSVIRVGMHSDWMGQDSSGNDRFLGPPSLEGSTLGSSPYSIDFIIDVPANTSLGTQNYYIGVDAQDSQGQYYSENTQSSTFQVIAASNAPAPNTMIPTAPTTSATANPTPTTTPTTAISQNDDLTSSTGDSNSESFSAAFSTQTVLIIAVVIIVLIICTVAVILFSHRKPQAN